jgi:hypothetical protein
MHAYLSSTSARIARLTLGLGILGVGLVAMAGPDGLYVIAGAPPLLIVGALFSVGLALAEHRLAAFALTLGLPLVGGPYVGLLYAARAFGAQVGLTIAAVGLALILIAFASPALAAPRAREAHA